MHTYIIIPAYNEQRRIKGTLDDYTSLIRRAGKDITILIVSESTDKTDSIVEGYSARYKNIKPLKSAKRLGKGGAVLEGFRHVCKSCNKNDVLGFVDADDSLAAAEAARMLDYMKDHRLDGVIGSRYMRGSVVTGRITSGRWLSSRGYNLLVRALFGLDYTDTQCGAKFFKAAAIRKVLDRIALHHTTFDLDILYKLREDGRRIEEIPIHYTVKGAGIRPAVLTIFFTTVGLRLSYTRAWKLIPSSVRYGLYKLIDKPR